MTYLNTDRMREQLRANPQWSKLEALEALFGMKATDRHLAWNAQSDGPADDERVKWSIPDQVDRWKLFYERDVAPGFVLTAEQVFPFIQIDEWDDGQALKFTEGYVRSKLVPKAVAVWLETAKPFDYWGDLYQRHLQRDPDTEGLAWWMEETERRFVGGIDPKDG